MEINIKIHAEPAPPGVHRQRSVKRDGQTNKQTDRQKIQRFWPPRRRVKSEPHKTWNGDRGPRARSCTSKTFWGPTHIVSPLRSAEYLTETRHHQLKTPISP